MMSTRLSHLFKAVAFPIITACPIFANETPDLEPHHGAIETITLFAGTPDIEVMLRYRESASQLCIGSNYLKASRCIPWEFSASGDQKIAKGSFPATADPSSELIELA